MADNIIYETKWYSERALAASSAGNRSAEGGLRDSRGWSNGLCFRQFCCTMARCLEKRRFTSSGNQADARSGQNTFGEKAGEVESFAEQGPKSFWLQDGSMDAGANCGGDPKKIPSLLPSDTSYANPEGNRLGFKEIHSKGRQTIRTIEIHTAKESSKQLKTKAEKAVSVLSGVMEMLRGVTNIPAQGLSMSLAKSSQHFDFCCVKTRRQNIGLKFLSFLIVTKAMERACVWLIGFVLGD